MVPLPPWMHLQRHFRQPTSQQVQRWQLVQRGLPGSCSRMPEVLSAWSGFNTRGVQCVDYHSQVLL